MLRIKNPSHTSEAIFAVLALALGLLTSSVAHADICRVTTDGMSTGTGSWASPMDLQTAISDPECNEIWVKAGTYSPTVDSGFGVSFKIQPGTGLYGGFNGAETVRAQRDAVVHLTVLSGGDHVVTMDGTTAAGLITSTTVLDGFTVRDGSANGGNLDFPDPENSGGGLYCKSGRIVGQCSPTLSNLKFMANFAKFGGAIFNEGLGGPTLTDVTFSDNRAASFGGAIYSIASDVQRQSRLVLNRVRFTGNTATLGGAIANTCASPLLRNASFINNSALDGGAIENISSNPTFQNVTFSNNIATRDGGAIFNNRSSPIFTNVTFNGNSAGGDGGVMFNLSTSPPDPSNPTFINVTIIDNSAGEFGGAFSNFGTENAIANSVFVNVILWGNQAGNGGDNFYLTGGGNTTIIDSVVQGGCPIGTSCSHIINSDPLLGPLQSNGGFTMTMLPDEESPVIDAGNDEQCPRYDQRDVSRPLGLHCDIGSVEVVQVGSIWPISGSGQQADTWTEFLNPLVVQVRDPYGLVVPDVRVHSDAAPAGQPNAMCADVTTDNAGFAVLYCRANGVAGGPYRVTIQVPSAGTVSPAVFFLTNTQGDTDIIFKDNFDPPAPPAAVGSPSTF